MKAMVHFGEQQVDPQTIRRALRKQEPYIKLADGSVSQIPDDWLEHYKKLFNLAEETETGLGVRHYHLPLEDPLLMDANESMVGPVSLIVKKALLPFASLWQAVRV